MRFWALERAILEAMPRRHLALDGPGRLLVSTDLHGNLEDYQRLVAIFGALRASADAPVHWVILGDLVHGPDEASRSRFDGLYDYDDRSRELVDAVCALREAFAGTVHFVLGNHDHAHVGGPTTRKFHADEAAHLESTMSEEARSRLRALFADALLLVTSSCGLALAHGAPPVCFESPDELDSIALPASDPAHARVVRAMTTPYGQPRDEMQRFLAAASRGGAPQRVLVHGHDKCEEGWFVEHDNQVCPVLFGARRANKRYVLADLDARYETAGDLRDGHELRRLYAGDSSPPARPGRGQSSPR